MKKLTVTALILLGFAGAAHSTDAEDKTANLFIKYLAVKICADASLSFTADDLDRMFAYVQTEVNKIGLSQESKDKQWGRAQDYVAKQALEPDDQGCSISATMLRDQLPDVIATPTPAAPPKSPF